jgi:hypothetical protein
MLLIYKVLSDSCWIGQVMDHVLMTDAEFCIEF